ncbi:MULTISPECIES: hypothetical protein [Saccharopolyspora]|uniref:Uncharacterized protein n=1 Tax=Saccharopolyspora elongata TaxID=2530387 RepID=A0A4R4Y668_9PSEU|nr:hypothetical protein [Saccharopolyspora elongata]TDD39310.1 hypothetical protein E1288_37205 [Saccharopolyspora elongata]
MSDRTAADPSALAGGAVNISRVADEARDLMSDFAIALDAYSNVFDGAGDGSGGYRGASGNDFVKIWLETVVPGQEYALKFLDLLDHAIGDAGERARGTAYKLDEADGDADSAASA